MVTEKNCCFTFLDIDWLDRVLRPIGNISAMQRRRLLVQCDQLWSFEVSLAALTSVLFIEFQWNGLVRAKRVVILDTKLDNERLRLDVNQIKQNFRNFQPAKENFDLKKQKLEYEIQANYN